MENVLFIERNFHTDRHLMINPFDNQKQFITIALIFALNAFYLNV